MGIAPIYDARKRMQSERFRVAMLVACMENASVGTVPSDAIYEKETAHA